jgi:hypothetical protein
VPTTICSKAPCSGKLAYVVVYRDTAGKITAYDHRGDPSSCADAPSTYFDPTGKDRGGIGMHPITPGSPEAKELDQRREALRGGGKEAETVSCAATSSK